MNSEEFYNVMCKERKHNYKGIIVQSSPIRVSATYLEAQINEETRKALAWAKDEKALKKLENINLDRKREK